jgi:hypothetical protein
MPTREHDCDHCRHWVLDPAMDPDAARVIAAIEGLGSLVREVRQARGLTLREVEAQSGVGFNTIRRVEQRTVTPDTASVLKLLKWTQTAEEANET